MIANCQETFHEALTAAGKCQLNRNCCHCRLMSVAGVSIIVKHWSVLNNSTHSEPLNESKNGMQ